MNEAKTIGQTEHQEEENKGTEGARTRNQQAKDFPREQPGKDFRQARDPNESSRDETQVQKSTSECERGEARAGGKNQEVSKQQSFVQFMNL